MFGNCDLPADGQRNDQCCCWMPFWYKWISDILYQEQWKHCQRSVKGIATM